MIEVALVCTFFTMLLFVLPPRYGSHNARPTAARVQIKVLGIALDAYKTDTGSYPQTIDGLKSLIQAPAGVINWHGPYMEKDIPPDPWGRNYIYVCPGLHNPESYDLSSRGADGFVGTDDDICNWPVR